MEKLQIIGDRIWKTITLVLLIAEFMVLPFEPLSTIVVYSLGIFIGGFLAYFIAIEYKGRKGIWPLLYGMVFGLWAIIYYLLIKNEKENETK